MMAYALSVIGTLNTRHGALMPAAARSRYRFRAILWRSALLTLLIAISAAACLLDNELPRFAITPGDMILAAAEILPHEAVFPSRVECLMRAYVGHGFFGGRDTRR